jgi:NAD+ synthase
MFVVKRIKNYELAYENIKNTASKYVKDNNLKSLVIGLSGGIDSTLVALIAREVCDENGIELIGASIPIKIPIISNEFTDEAGWEENDVAIKFGNAICDKFEIADLSSEAKLMWDRLENSPHSETILNYKIRRGNIMARLRMIYLYDLAQKNSGMVLSTDNLTEYLLGFWTLHGDVGDYGMIQKLWKTEVYKMTKWLSKSKYKMHSNILLEIINKKPTDGLGISDNDLVQLGVDSYEKVDEILINFLNNKHKNGYLKSMKPNLVIQRHLRNSYKRQNPTNINRSRIMKEYNYE